MLIEFNQLPETARIWMYQANRPMNHDEMAFVEAHITQFLTSWKSHGEEIKVSMKIVNDQFLILAADENHNTISGCSIDSSLREVQQLGNELNIDFLTKLNIAYLNESTVITVSIPTFKQGISDGKINQDTIVFNNMVTTIRELNQQWQIAAKHSWMSKYFKKEASI